MTDHPIVPNDRHWPARSHQAREATQQHGDEKPSQHGRIIPSGLEPEGIAYVELSMSSRGLSIGAIEGTSGNRDLYLLGTVEGASLIQSNRGHGRQTVLEGDDVIEDLPLGGGHVWLSHLHSDSATRLQFVMWQLGMP